MDEVAVRVHGVGWDASARVDPAIGASPTFEGLFLELRPKLQAFLSVQYGHHVAEELAQEALARAHLHWPALAASPQPQAWVFRVAMNLGASLRRRRAAERRALEQAGRDTHPAPGQPDHDDVLAVREAVMALPRRARSVLLLRYFADLSIAQTAAVLRCTPGTVKSDTHDAVAALRRRGLLADEERSGGR